jgi:hypothetical protein
MLIRILSPEKFVHIKDACRYYGIEFEEVEETLQEQKVVNSKKIKQKQVEQG